MESICEIFGETFEDPAGKSLEDLVQILTRLHNLEVLHNTLIKRKWGEQVTVQKRTELNLELTSAERDGLNAYQAYWYELAVALGAPPSEGGNDPARKFITAMGYAFAQGDERSSFKQKSIRDTITTIKKRGGVEIDEKQLSQALGEKIEESPTLTEEETTTENDPEITLEPIALNSSELLRELAECLRNATLIVRDLEELDCS